MGRVKALLPVRNGGPTFLRQLSASLLQGGASDVIVVGRPDDGALEVEVALLGDRVRLVVNPHAERGQLSSILIGLNAADRPGVRAVLVGPVDAPLVRGDTVRALLEAFRACEPPVVRPVYRGRHGHPVIFGRQVFDALRHADPAMGAKAVVRGHAGDAIELEVDDPAVLDDVDGPEEYARLLAREQ